MTGGPGDSMIDILNSVPSPSLSDWVSLHIELSNIKSATK